MLKVPNEPRLTAPDLTDPIRGLQRQAIDCMVLGLQEVHDRSGDPEYVASVVVKFLDTAVGKARFRKRVEEAFAKGADKFPEGSYKWHLARACARLPPKLV